eukprot:TRINITY_DN335_c0_g1_i4.p1 TRINITY_DN335_c0_g1~~TRINITY_DN335_c0_g1_i4.p1  ORF type:complete len:111 (-),score=16.93 TRINITY_DN335_c0_g1_i4:25-357(-)
MAVDYPGYAYGSLVAMGGIMGYVKRRSVPSLIAGVTCGSLALYGAYSVSNDGKTASSIVPGLATAALLSTVMGARAAKSGKLMPAGAIALLSLGMVARYGILLYDIPAKS